MKLLISLFAVAAVNCRQIHTHNGTATLVVGGDGHGHHKSCWSYGDQNHNKAWNCPGQEKKPTCVGKRQSPINIETTEGAVGKAYNDKNFKPKAVGNLKLINGGHNFQVNGKFGNFYRARKNAGNTKTGEKGFDNKGFEVAQFHFHSPSEHAIDGKLAAAEMHIVTTSATKGGDELLVLGILFDVAEEGDTGDTFLDAIKLGHGPAPGDSIDIDNFGPGVDAKIKLSVLEAFADILQGPVYKYEGSLTTPPCSQIVHWNVFEERAVMTKQEIEHFKKVFGSHGNNRKLQDLNGRKVRRFDNAWKPLTQKIINGTKKAIKKVTNATKAALKKAKRSTTKFAQYTKARAKKFAKNATKAATGFFNWADQALSGVAAKFTRS